MYNMTKIFLLLLLLLIAHLPLQAQELEPRALTNVPVGLNFAVFGYGYSQGNILLDPAIPIEDLDSHLHAIFAAYVRAINFFGLSGKLDVIVPAAFGDWTGFLEGEGASRKIDGLGDPRVRLSVNFVGAPALRLSEYQKYQQKTIAGAAMQIFVPLGKHDPSKLINLGSNRWTIRSQIGIARTFEKWIVESYVDLWIFTNNMQFLEDLKLSQNPLITAKVHLVRTMRKGRWIALDVGYGFGGRTSVEDVPRDTYISTFRFGLTLAFPVSPKHTLKLVGASGVRLQKGPDFDALAVTYQYRWGS
jgi:hypothetical protein